MGVVAAVGQGSERAKRRTTHSAPGRSQVGYHWLRMLMSLLHSYVMHFIITQSVRKLPS